MTLLTIVRWVHVSTAAAWLGEVVVINFVLVPAVKTMPPDRQGGFIARVFPRVFRLASYLAVIALVSGLGLSYLMTGWRDVGLFVSTRWGLAILAGGGLGSLLALFHFVVEGRLKPTAESLSDAADEEEIARVLRFLQVVPRAGMLVILLAFILMMVAARG